MTILVVVRNASRTKLLKEFSTKEELTRKRKNRETFWMKELRTLTPYGLNNNCQSKDWANL